MYLYQPHLREAASLDGHSSRRTGELDALTLDVTGKLVERATVDSELVPSYLDLVFVARVLERIGDHATNIAEDSFWRDQAADIRHTYGPKKED